MATRRKPTPRSTAQARADHEAHVRQQAAVRMLTDGYSYDEIATELGYADRSGAYRAVQAVLSRADYAEAEGLRNQDGLILAEAERRLWARYRELDDMGVGITEVELKDADRRRIDEWDDDGEGDGARKSKRVVISFDANDAANRTMTELLRVQTRRARLFGLDAPTKIDHTVSDAMDAEIRRMLTELDMNDPDAQGVQLVEEADEVDEVDADS